jgi:flavodoxin I
MNKVLLVYWPKDGNVAKVAAKVALHLSDSNLTKKDITEITQQDLNDADNWIIGGSTVGSHVWMDAEDSNKWFRFFKMLDDIDLTKKVVAFFGLGDQILYPHHFVDGLGVFQEEFEKRNANITGQWPIDGYQFYDSEGMHKDKFFGLALDEDHQQELTDERIQQWLQQVLLEFK